MVRRQWRLVKKDGTQVPVEVISRSYLEGGLLRTAGLIRDLTAERAAEEALEESRTRLQTIIDTALSAVVTMDGKGTITSWNRQAERCFGWPAKEAVGRDLAETIIPLRRRDEHRGGLARYLETGEGPVLGRLVEMEALHRDGSEFPVEIAISPASRQAEGVTFVAFVRDITERRREESARAAEYEINSTLVRATSWTEAAPGVLQALCVHL